MTKAGRRRSNGPPPSPNAGGSMQRDRTATEVAWAAGLFEGEGCMNAYPRGKRGSGAQARLTMTDRDVVERFAAIVACGSVRFKHSPAHQAKGHKPLYEWYVHEAAEVVRVIEMLLPYFGERRSAKAMEVLAVAREIDVHKGKRTYCPNGHPYSGDNLIEEPIVRAGRQYVARRCRTCRRAQSRERMRRDLRITPDRFRKD